VTSSLRISPIALGEAVKRFCRTNASFEILWSMRGGARSCGWSDGGCWTLAAAIQQGWGGELYALSRTGSEAQHIVTCFDKVFVDQDGPGSAGALIRRFERWEVIPTGSLRMLPFTAAMGQGIPEPEGQEEIISGIYNYSRFGRRL
jgi:hypothetical protein